MKVLALTLLLVACASASLEVQQALDNGLHPLSAEMVELINRQPNQTWTAKQHFTEKDLEDVKVKMGTILDITQLPKHYNDDLDMEAEIPETFDSKTAFAECGRCFGQNTFIFNG